MEDEGFQTVRAAIPKFASFRPKGNPLSHADRSPGRNEGSKSHQRQEISHALEWHTERQGRTGHHRERHRSKEHTKLSGHDSSGRHRHRVVVPDNSMSQESVFAAWKETPELYVADRQGDPNNLTYGTLHHYIIPPYLRTGAGSILGLSIENKIDRTPNNDSGLVTSNYHWNRASRRERSLLSESAPSRTKELRIRQIGSPDPALEHGKDFVPLLRSRKRKRKLREENSTSSASGTSDEGDCYYYRSIEGKAKSRAGPADRDLEYAMDPAVSDNGLLRPISPEEANRQRNVELSRRVDSRPTDVDAWLELINHQDYLLGTSDSGKRPKLTNAEQSSIADVKLSMYEKALEKVKGDEQLERLVLGMMEEGSEIWDTKKLGSRWHGVLEKYPASIGLWTRYLDFRQTNFISFQYEDCRTVFLDCFGVLKSVFSKSVGLSPSGNAIDRTRIYIFLRLTLFMRESGYVEHAVGLWQGLLEFNVFMPKQLILSANNAPDTSTFNHSLSSFEEFWESEVPRIGEEGAKGWDAWTMDGGSTATPRMDVPNISVDENRVFESWMCSERYRALASRSPARTFDDVQEDDPFRVILFTDLRDCLFCLTSSSLQSELLNAFLAFCRLPPFNSECAGRHAVDWRTESHFMNDALEESNTFLAHWYLDGVPTSATKSLNSEIEEIDTTQTTAARQKSLFDYPARRFRISQDSLFPEGEWFSVFDTWTSRYEGDNGPVELPWMRRVLKMLVDVGIGGESLAEYYLAFELTIEPNRTRKLAKSLLKKHATSLRLYNTYALIEARTGNKASADHVISTAITMSKEFGEDARHDAILLWRTWLWGFLAAGDLESALKHLLALPESTAIQDPNSPDPPFPARLRKPSSAALLRVQRALTDGREQMLSIGRTSHAMLYAECLALLAYLSHDVDIHAALEVFRETSSGLVNRNLTTSPAHELLHQSKAKLFYHHTQHTKSFKPALIRSSLAESIHIFPTNTIFLSLYAWNEARFRIDDRVRSIMRNVVLQDQNPTITAWFFSIWSELHKGIQLGSNSHSVRATFENAVTSQSGKSNPALWKLYLLFEHRLGELRRAKDVFYRGVRGCPWAKEFYMLAFEHLRDVLSFDELRKIYEVLGEKGLRVHLDLEDVFERYDERRVRVIVGGDSVPVVGLPDDGNSDDA